MTEPDEPAGGRSCDCGGCDGESVGWLWYPDLNEWLPACERHLRDKRIHEKRKRHDSIFEQGRLL